MCNVLQLGEVVYRPTCVRSLACNAFLSILSHRSNRNNDGKSNSTSFLVLSTEKVSPVVCYHCKEMPCMLLVPLLIVKTNTQSYYSHLISKRIMAMKKLINPLFKSEMYV